MTVGDRESGRARPCAASDECARLRAALAVIALGGARSPERFASLVLDGLGVDAARAEDARRWREEVGV